MQAPISYSLCYSQAITTRENVIRDVQNLAIRDVWLYTTAITPLIWSYPWCTTCTPRLGDTSVAYTSMYSTSVSCSRGVHAVRHWYEYLLPRIETIAS
jgi:hypothetical protein